MTNKQKQVLALRAEGKTLQEIADITGCTKQNVSLMLQHGISEKQHENRIKKYNILYPNIEKYLRERNMSVCAFQKECGIKTLAILRNCIVYGRDTKKSVIDAILEVTGMTYEEAFRREVK